jgi:arylsulfatase A-like enzyme
MLEYMDDVLGRLFDYMDSSKLRDNTYVLVMSDNGAELFPEERKGNHRMVRERPERGGRGAVRPACLPRHQHTTAACTTP